jgi:hypothetical protein
LAILAGPPAAAPVGPSPASRRCLVLALVAAASWARLHARLGGGGADQGLKASVLHLRLRKMILQLTFNRMLYINWWKSIIITNGVHHVGRGFCRFGQKES